VAVEGGDFLPVGHEQIVRELLGIEEKFRMQHRACGWMSPMFQMRSRSAR
jgi:hypothetical protein